MTNDFRWYAPIVKVDVEKRTVSGWATTEEIDKQNEVVDYNGSKEAFANWQGNIREMHEPKAVGKAVEIIPNDGEKRVWVSAYISKGADDTWQKVKEGVLTGFSIGGQTMHKTAQIVKDMATGGSRTVNRITKYRLNELSLVDNPANPGCSFTLVKTTDGVPFQTEIVEDSIKLVITEAEDPLKAEIHDHRDKADSLTKKVLDREELDKLSDNDFGVIRKYCKDETFIKERLLPMSDKVHAVTALAIMEKYNLTPDEQEAVHKKAQAILGSAYQTHNVSNRGGENAMSSIDLTKINDVLESLAKKVEALEKAFEGAYRPVPGAKETPESPSNTPALDKSTAEKAMAGVANGNITDAPEVKPAAAEKPAEVAVSVEKPVSVQPDAPTGTVLPATSNPSDAPAVKPSAAVPANDIALPAAPEVPAKAAEEVVKAEDKKDETKEDPKEEAKETKAEEKKEDEEEKKKKEAKKVADATSENDVAKMAGELESLRKRFDAVTELLKKPMPRKRIIEKNDADTKTNEDTEFQGLRKQVLGWIASGKPLTAEQEKVRDQVLNKSLDSKFGKTL